MVELLERDCLDPFAGTGTTGLAASNLGFSCTLIEAEAEYCHDIRKKCGLSPSAE